MRITNVIHKVGTLKIGGFHRFSFIKFLGETHSPKYSMGSRTKYRRCDAFPSANSYSLPPLIGPRIPSKQASNAYRYAHIHYYC